MTIILGALLGLSIIALIVTVVLFKLFRRCNLETTGEMLFECGYARGHVIIFSVGAVFLRFDTGVRFF